MKRLVILVAIVLCASVLSSFLVARMVETGRTDEVADRLARVIEDRDRTRALLRASQDTLKNLLRRQKQLERFIRRHGFTPPPDTQGQSSTSGSQTPQNGPGDNGGSDGPSKPPKPPKPSPSPSPTPEDCIAEILGTCV